MWLCRLRKNNSGIKNTRSFWSAPRIATSGKVQLSENEESILFSYSQLIRFARLDSEHAQSDRNFMNGGLPVLDLLRGSPRTGSRRGRKIKFGESETEEWAKRSGQDGGSSLASFRLTGSPFAGYPWCWPKGARPLGTRIVHCRNMRGLGRVSYINQIENLNIPTEMCTEWKAARQVREFSAENYPNGSLAEVAKFLVIILWPVYPIHTNFLY